MKWWLIVAKLSLGIVEQSNIYALDYLGDNFSNEFWNHNLLCFYDIH